MSMTNSLRKRLLDAYYSGATLSAPASFSVGLSTTTPTVAGGNVTEPADTYARQSYTNNATNWPAATTADPSVKSNGVVIEFPEATASWGTITHWVIWDGANVVDFGALSPSKAISTGDTARIPVGGIVVSLDAV